MALPPEKRTVTAPRLDGSKKGAATLLPHGHGSALSKVDASHVLKRDKKGHGTWEVCRGLENAFARSG